MSFTREKIKDFYLLTTDIENIFINEYMPAAPGEYVKVFLYGLLYSQNSGQMTHKKMASQLGMTEAQVEEAWDYWDKLGVVSKRYVINSETYNVEFKQLRSLMYGLGGKIQEDIDVQQEVEEPTPLESPEAKEVLWAIEGILARPLSYNENMEIVSWLNDIGASQEVILGAVEYCVEKGKRGINYIAKVVLQWTKDGFKTTEDVKKHISTLEERFGNYKKVLQTLGLNRPATEAEREMMDNWFDVMQFNMDRVMDACVKASFISNPNLKYVNKVLENWYEEAKVDGRNVNNKLTISNTDLNKYYEHLRKTAEAEAEGRKDEVYSSIPRIKEIDDELLDLGMKLSRTLLGGSLTDVDKTKKLIELLEQERAVLLTENNYREDYTDIKYACDRCSDTGVTEEGGRCSCTKERMGEAELWLTSSLSKN